MEANGDEHTIKLRRQLTVSGRAVDSETGSLIAAFKVFPGYGMESTCRVQHDTRHCTNGVFKIIFTEDKFPWRIRVEADGYEQGISESLPEDFAGELEVKLKRPNSNKKIRGMVLRPDGEPAVGAEVALLTFERGASIDQGRFVPQGSHSILSSTDADGKFQFSPDVNAHTVVAVDSLGFGHTRIREDAQAIVMQLSPLGRIDGRVRTRDGNWNNRDVALMAPYSEAGLHIIFRAKSDADGHFVIESIPAGGYTLHLNPGVGKSFTDATPVEIKAGETTDSQIGGNGATITGRFELVGSGPVDWAKQTKFPVMQAKSEPRPASSLPPLDRRFIDPVKGRKRLDHVESDAFRAWIRNQQPNVTLKILADGSFTAEGARAGEYSLRVELAAEAMESSNNPLASFQRATIASIRQSVIVSEAQEQAGETLNLGVLQLQPAAPNPKRGDSESVLRAVQ